MRSDFFYVTVAKTSRGAALFTVIKCLLGYLIND